LRKVPLELLSIASTNVSDLSPLVGKKLYFLDIIDTPAAQKEIPKGVRAEIMLKATSENAEKGSVK
jgi:hypothetical protein